MKAIQTANKGGNSRFSLKNNNYIKLLSNINRTGLFSAFTFILLALTCLFPISKGEQSTEAVTGTAQSSSLTLSVTGDTASVELDVNSTDGTFASSSAANSASFSVVTNNFSGYTLSISGSDNDGKLYDTTKKYFLEPLTSATSEADFSSTSSLNGKWGYKPSKFNSAVNSNYLPAPTTTASTLDKTSVANTTANDYTISLGLRADYGTAANTYTNAFVITAVPNPIAYVITYNANTTDTVSNMPAAQNSTTSATSITLSDKTPTRADYDFKGWCTTAPMATNPDTCTGTTYKPGDTYGIDQTVENITTLYAMWTRNGITITYDANGGHFSDDTSKTANIVVYDSNISTITKTSRMQDIDADFTDTVTIPGASELHVRVQYAFTGDDGLTGMLEVSDGSGQVLANLQNESSFGVCTYIYSGEKEFTVSGDTVSFDYKAPICESELGCMVPFDCACGECTSFKGYSATVIKEGITILEGEEQIPTRNGYIFDGWYTDVAGTVGNEFTLAAGTTSQTVYAKWISPKITFVAGTGGTIDRTVQSPVHPGVEFTQSNNIITVDGVTTTATANSGYEFYYWANECGNKMPADDCTITAVFRIPPMQNYTASRCQAEAYSAPAKLQDTRDRREYNVRYINGVCTMIDNLDFQISTGMTLNPSTTNVTANKTLGTVGSLTSGNSYDEMRILKSTTTGYGTYYNYAAATAGTITGSSNSTEASQDICPKGWHLPTHDEQTSIAGSTGYSTANVTAFNAVAAGNYNSGSLSNSGPLGLWWSSSASNTVYRYSLYYDASNGLNSGNNSVRNYGLSVRCVLK